MTNPPGTTVVYLTAEQIEEMMIMQKRLVFIRLLESVGVFDIRNGKAIINFDALGAVTSVEVQQVFRQKLDKVT